MELIPEAELIPECSTLRNRMTAPLLLIYSTNILVDAAVSHKVIIIAKTTPPSNTPTTQQWRHGR
jgi:hypothetical protein